MEIWLLLQISMAYGPWDSTMHKYSLCALPPIPLSYFFLAMEQIHLKEMESSFSPSGPFITQPGS